jgi:hypothetical protein
MLAFTGPTGEYTAQRLLPLDLRELEPAALSVVQRKDKDRKKQFFKDLEIFMVFTAAYESLDPADRLAWITDWQERFGKAEPPQPKGDGAYPLWWLRESPVFWERGGQFWWWAAHALRKSEGFNIDDQGRVSVTLPDGKGKFSS